MQAWQSAAVAEATALLRERGLKCTRQRMAVLQVLSSSACHLSVAEVYRRVKAREPRTGLATVYRALELLTDLRLVVRLHLEDGCNRYAIASRRHMHQLVCKDCGLVVEVGDCSLNEMSEKLARRAGFEIEGHWLQFYGRCRTCASTRSSTSQGAARI